jgi:membrane protease YdiL (CAAX protease family)
MPPNTACTGRLGLAAFFEHYSKLWQLPISKHFSPQPPLSPNGDWPQTVGPLSDVVRKGNTTNLQTNIHPSSNKTHEVISWTMVAGLLFLRLPLSAGVGYFAPTPWLDPLVEICTYVLTLCLIWWERDRLALFHIDALSIVIIIFLKPLQTLFLGITRYESILAFPNFPSWMIWISAAVLFFVIRKRRPDLLKVQKISWRWFGIGTLAGIGLALLLGYPMALQTDASLLPYKPGLFSELLPVLPLFVYQISSAAITEEPLFRGFLWGHLRKAGWNELGIWLFQALLFALGHIYYLHQRPISFWVIVPVAALVFGLLAWKSRTIASSMATHGLSNVLITTVARLIAPYTH